MCKISGNGRQIRIAKLTIQEDAKHPSLVHPRTTIRCQKPKEQEKTCKRIVVFAIAGRSLRWAVRTATWRVKRLMTTYQINYKQAFSASRRPGGVKYHSYGRLEPQA